jgi:hypothetical protein
VPAGHRFFVSVHVPKTAGNAGCRVRSGVCLDSVIVAIIGPFQVSKRSVGNRPPCPVAIGDRSAVLRTG